MKRSQLSNDYFSFHLILIGYACNIRRFLCSMHQTYYKDEESFLFQCYLTNHLTTDFFDFLKSLHAKTSLFVICIYVCNVYTI